MGRDRKGERCGGMVSSRNEPQWKGGEMKVGWCMQMVSSLNEPQCMPVDKKAGWCGGKVPSKNDPVDGGERVRMKYVRGWYLLGMEHGGLGETKMDVWWDGIFHE